MSSNYKPIPRFQHEDEEREFWATHDSTEYIDWSQAEKNPSFSRLKPSTGNDRDRINTGKKKG